MTVKRILVILATLGVLAGGTAAAASATATTASAPTSFYHA